MSELSTEKLDREALEEMAREWYAKQIALEVALEAENQDMREALEIMEVVISE